MIPHLFYYQLVVPGLLWLCILLHAVWPSRGAVSPQRPADLSPSRLNVNALTSPGRL